MTLEPGDLIVTGTPAGVGMSHESPLYMKPGDICEIEIERIGTLRIP
jgi:2-keto-4-pentenoate hydratase/2-oxohepta-3-ene-1,7-dioic acid hydratase in catechol pathway